MSLKMKMFISIGLSIAIIFAAFFFYNFNANRKNIMEEEKNTLIAITESVDMLMNKQLETASTGALAL